MRSTVDDQQIVCPKDDCAREFDSQRSLSLHLTKGHDDSKPWRDLDTLSKDYWEEGLTQPEIAEKYGVAQGTISRAMRELGIERRDHGENVRKEFATFYTDKKGYEQWVAFVSGEGRPYRVPVHRLVAVAEHGFEALRSMAVHHKNRIPWDNRPENLQVITPNEHTRLHNQMQDRERDRLGRFT